MKALVLLTSPLDKIAHALLAVASFKDQMPELEVTWVARDVFAPLVAACDCVESAIAVPRRFGLGRAAALVRRIRAQEFDVAIDFEGHARTGAMVGAARAARKIGRIEALEGATIFYNELAPLPGGGSEHALDRYLEFGRAFGLEPRARQALAFRDLSLPPLAWAEAGGGRRVCLFPGRFKVERAWPGMFELAERLLERFSDLSVFCLGLDAVPPPVALSRRFGSRFADMQAATPWPQTLAMLAAADLVVANDNGPAQLAGAMGRPNLAVYGFVSADARGSYPVGHPRNGILRAPRGRVADVDRAEAFETAERLLNL